MAMLLRTSSNARYSESVVTIEVATVGVSVCSDCGVKAGNKVIIL